MQNNYGLDSNVLDYLIKKRQPQPTGLSENQLVAGLSDLSSSLGTIGGQRAVTGNMQKLADSFDAKQMERGQSEDQKKLAIAQLLDRKAQLGQKRDQMIADRGEERSYKESVFDKNQESKLDLLDRQNQLAKERANQKRDADLEHFKTKQDYITKNQNLKTNEKNQSKFVPGVGMAFTESDAKKLKSASIQKDKFNRQLDEMIAIRLKNDGGTFNQIDVARGRQLSKDLLLTYKNIAKLGVLSAADEKIINAIIAADPTEYVLNPLAIGTDPILNNMYQLRRNVDDEYYSNIDMRLKEASPEFEREPLPGREYYEKLNESLANVNLEEENPQDALANDSVEDEKRFSWEVD
jgi:hypothetical protein